MTEQPVGPTEASDTQVLVTGGSGFVGSRVILQLLGAGYRVRTTVRTSERQAGVRELLSEGGHEPGEALSFAVADLTSDEGWLEAADGTDFVLHVASPFPGGAPQDENELIAPAREGTLRVLRASRDAGVERVVMTSSFATIGYSPKTDGTPYSEEDWTDPNGNVGAYVKSKTLAERAAWDFVAEEGGKLELSVVNPVGIFGPVLGSDYSSSIQIVRRMLDGEVRGTPRLSFGVVDVRDVAELHLRAMTNPSAVGQRFLAAAGDTLTMHEMALMLRKNLGERASRVPSRELPDWAVRVGSWFSPTLRPMVPELGRTKKITNQKARRVLGWEPRSNEEAIVATARSLIENRLLQN